jgi:hypothetical protein
LLFQLNANAHLDASSEGRLEADGMVEHDGHVGQLLKKLDDLGIADNTTDNGANMMTWPDGGSTSFRGEKATGWEGGFRVPCVSSCSRGRRVSSGTRTNEIRCGSLCSNSQATFHSEVGRRMKLKTRLFMAGTQQTD